MCIYTSLIVISCIMAQNNVEWVKSQRGKDKLVVDEYLFESNGKGKSAGVVYWICANVCCKVNAKTVDRQLVEIKGLINPGDHGHANDKAVIASMKLQVRISSNYFEVTFILKHYCDTFLI
jgi:hypothetical protein